VKAARGGLTLADVGEWSTYDCGHDVVARSAALADGSEDVLAAVYGPGSNDPTLFGWRVWAPGSPAHLPLASGPETGAEGRAAADAALARMLGAGPACSAEVEAEAGEPNEGRGGSPALVASLRARLAAAEERAAKAEGERDEARRDLARVAGALGADSLDGETLLLRLAALRGSRP
jgi:hypothetical protein